MTQDIISPMPGIFYRKPGPDKDPYVGEGDTVQVGDTIGLVEIMKQFAEVSADVAGVITHFHVEDGAMVNAGDPLATVEVA